MSMEIDAYVSRALYRDPRVPYDPPRAALRGRATRNDMERAMTKDDYLIEALKYVANIAKEIDESDVSKPPDLEWLKTQILLLTDTINDARYHTS